MLVCVMTMGTKYIVWGAVVDKMTTRWSLATSRVVMVIAPDADGVGGWLLVINRNLIGDTATVTLIDNTYRLR